MRLADGRRFVIEMAPIPDGQAHERGVVAEGPVGARWAGRLRIFRYEVRLWQDGVIPDVAEAVESPQRLTRDPDTAEQVCKCVRELPTSRTATAHRRRTSSPAGHAISGGSWMRR